jgi:hypothetical protein
LTPRNLTEKVGRARRKLGDAIEMAQAIHSHVGGAVETGQGRVVPTQLGRDILDDSSGGRAARVTAFLNVELFRVMYDQYKANILPPPPAIERQMEQLGVSPKQKERARQTFMKSAQYAGFIDASSGRFVKPGIAAREETPLEKPDDGKKHSNGSDGNEPPGLHPFVQGLLKELPKAGETWPEEQRKLWLDTAASIFKMIYKDQSATPFPGASPVKPPPY